MMYILLSADVLSRMNADQLEDFAQSLFDETNFIGDNKSKQLFEQVKDAYKALTGEEVQLTYNCLQ